MILKPATGVSAALLLLTVLTGCVSSTEHQPDAAPPKTSAQTPRQDAAPGPPPCPWNRRPHLVRPRNSSLKLSRGAKQSWPAGWRTPGSAPVLFAAHAPTT